MDEIVLRAMQKWPNVPRVYGWLRLERRGRWLVKGPSGFETIGHAAFADFIGRNYGCDEQGCWYFQNGPQRVFVALDYAPWVYRLGDRGDGLVTHTGRAVNDVRALFFDEQGAMLAQTWAGIGLVLDRDLAALLERLRAENPSLGDEAELLDRAVNDVGQLRLFGRLVSTASVRSEDVPARFGFNPRPAPPAGELEC